MKDRYVRAARRPFRGIGGAEERESGDSDGRSQVRDAGIVADEEACAIEMAGERAEIFQEIDAADSGCPFDRFGEPGREFLVPLEWPVLAFAAGKGVEEDRWFWLGGGQLNTWN